MALVPPLPDAAIGAETGALELQIEIGARAEGLQTKAEQLKKEVASRFARFDVKKRHKALRKALLSARRSDPDPPQITRTRRRAVVLERTCGATPDRAQGVRNCEDGQIHKDVHAVEERDDYVSFAISNAS